MRRILKASEHASAGVEIGESAVRMSGSRENFFYTDGSGCYIVGPVSFLAQPENIRVAANYVLPTAYEGAIPSTLASPQAIFVENSPVEGFADLAEEVGRLLGELL